MVGAILSLAYPDRIAKNRGNGSFTLANGRGGNVDQASPLSREPFIAVAELTGSAAQARIVLAAPIALAEIEQRFADRIENRDEVDVRREVAEPARPALAQARRHRAREQTRKVEPNDETARLLAQGVARVGIDKLPWTKALTQWRDRVMFLRRAEGDEWPDLSDAALAVDHRLAACRSCRQDGGVATLARRSAFRADRTAPLAAAPPPRRRSADPFRGADRHRTPRSTTRPRPARPSRSACRSCSASRSIPRSRAGAFRW